MGCQCVYIHLYLYISVYSFDQKHVMLSIVYYMYITVHMIYIIFSLYILLNPLCITSIFINTFNFSQDMYVCVGYNYKLLVL